jgi:hypothetical protein
VTATAELLPYALVPIDELVPYDRNARTHSPAQVAEIAASIREFGWTTPVLVDENHRLIAGHGRVTLIACEASGRRCYALELAPCYVDVAVRRWQAFTGLDAVLAGDGRPFSAVAAERG